MCTVEWPDPTGVLSPGHHCVLDTYHSDDHRCKCGDSYSRLQNVHDHLTPELIFDLGQWAREVITYDANARVIEQLAHDFGLMIERQKMVEEKRRGLALSLADIFCDALGPEAPDVEDAAHGLYAVLNEIDRRSNEIGLAVDASEKKKDEG